MSGGGLALYVWLGMSLFKIAIIEVDASAIKAQVRHILQTNKQNKTPQKRQGLCYNSTLIFLSIPDRTWKCVLFIFECIFSQHFQFYLFK